MTCTIYIELPPTPEMKNGSVIWVRTPTGYWNCSTERTLGQGIQTVSSGAESVLCLCTKRHCFMTRMFRIRADDTGPFVNVSAECQAEVGVTLKHTLPLVGALPSETHDETSNVVVCPSRFMPHLQLRSKNLTESSDVQH